MCGGGDRDGIEGSLGHWGLWTAWRTLCGHEHHRGVAGRRVVRWHNARLHMGLLYMGHVVGVVAMLHLWLVDIDGLLGGGE